MLSRLTNSWNQSPTRPKAALVKLHCNMQDSAFKEQIYHLVAQIPQGRLMTYGQIAALCGRPRAAWEVGQIAHFGPPELPWQRVVNKQGGLAKGWPGGIDIHR